MVRLRQGEEQSSLDMAKSLTSLPLNVSTPNSNGMTKKNGKSGTRKSNAGLLTKKFVNLILEAKDGTLDLNRIAEVLDV